MNAIQSGPAPGNIQDWLDFDSQIMNDDFMCFFSLFWSSFSPLCNDLRGIIARIGGYSTVVDRLAATREPRVRTA